MKQVTPNGVKGSKQANKNKKYKAYKPAKGYKQIKRGNKEYGTSKLEKKFAKDFLDKAGLSFIYQYEAKDIKRFFDFAVSVDDKANFLFETKEGVKCVKDSDGTFCVDLLIEVDGSYHHADPRVVKENKIKPMHKHNMFVDKIKDRWAALHHIPLLRVWEYDINKNPKLVKEKIREAVAEVQKKREISEQWKQPH